MSEPRRAPSKRRTVAVILSGMVVVFVALSLAATYVIGPRFGIWIVPPTPQRYAQNVVDHLNGGYYATTPEWQTWRAKVLEAGSTATTIDELYPVIATATKVAGGKHSFFRTPSEASSNDQQAAADFKAPTLATAGRITTITVPELGGVSADQLQQYADTAAQGIEAAAPTTCGWVIDLRGNTGGNMYPMLAGLVPLLPDGPALVFRQAGGTESTVTVKDGGIGFGGAPTMKTAVRAKISNQPIAVLYDTKTASSGEAVATAFRGLPNARSFGSATAGYTSGNAVIPMPDGARLVLTQAVYVDRAGVNLNEQPMQPDVKVDPTTADAAAKAWLATTCS